MSKSSQYRRRVRNIVVETKELAEQFLKNHQETQVVPKRFSGVLTPRFGDYILVWQYKENRLVGAVSIHRDNVSTFSMNVSSSTNGFDYKAAAEMVSSYELGGDETIAQEEEEGEGESDE